MDQVFYGNYGHGGVLRFGTGIGECRNFRDQKKTPETVTSLRHLVECQNSGFVARLPVLTDAAVELRSTDSRGRLSPHVHAAEGSRCASGNLPSKATGTCLHT